jgi:hypothetical protein
MVSGSPSDTRSIFATAGNVFAHVFASSTSSARGSSESCAMAVSGSRDSFSSRACRGSVNACTSRSACEACRAPMSAIRLTWAFCFSLSVSRSNSPTRHCQRLRTDHLPMSVWFLPTAAAQRRVERPPLG